MDNRNRITKTLPHGLGDEPFGVLAFVLLSFAESFCPEIDSVLGYIHGLLLNIRLSKAKAIRVKVVLLDVVSMSVKPSHRSRR